jgi:hypothetical protein
MTSLELSLEIHPWRQKKTEECIGDAKWFIRTAVNYGVIE